MIIQQIKIPKAEVVTVYDRVPNIEVTNSLPIPQVTGYNDVNAQYNWYRYEATKFVRALMKSCPQGFTWHVMLAFMEQYPSALRAPVDGWPTMLNDGTKEVSHHEAK